jgi:hypothetical protein
MSFAALLFADADGSTLSSTMAASDVQNFMAGPSVLDGGCCESTETTLNYSARDVHQLQLHQLNRRRDIANLSLPSVLLLSLRADLH